MSNEHALLHKTSDSIDAHEVAQPVKILGAIGAVTSQNTDRRHYMRARTEVAQKHGLSTAIAQTPLVLTENCSAQVSVFLFVAPNPLPMLDTIPWLKARSQISFVTIKSKVFSRGRQSPPRER